VLEEAADEARDRILADIEVDEAVPGVAEVALEVVHVAGKERHRPGDMQERDDRLIRHAFVTEIDTDLPHADATGAELVAFILVNILVEDVHGPGDFSRMSGR
jgi:hypothetical protein